MKLMALYLPQFHQVPENDSWWGEGYTEWDNVKKAKSYFKGHKQPQKPLDDNYYDLTDAEVLRWQAKLAKRYGIDGFSFYHYWFKDSHKVLYKPAELLLNNKDINIEYHFTWANHDWVKKIKNESKGEKTLLVDYGGKQQWKAHYKYLSQFFHDDRYTKVNGRPLFIFYHYHDIWEKAKGMLGYWNELAIQDGFPGLCFVAMDFNRTSDSRKEIFSDQLISYSLDFVPGRVRDELRNAKDWLRVGKRILGRMFPGVNFWNKFMAITFDYEEFQKLTLNYPHAKRHWRNCLVNYDDTPRVGKGGIIALNDNPAKFQEYLEKTLEHSLLEGQEFVYLTAWNEWGETNHLEPDSIYGYGWLKAVSEARKKVGV